jgi:hypothetical protein
MFFNKRLAVITATLLIAFGATAQETTLSSESHTRKEQRANRGISDMKTHIVPKGQWVFGGSLTYSTHNNSDYTFLIIEDIKSTGYSVKVSPLVGYSIAPNSIIGLRGTYGRSFLNMDSASLHLGEGDAALNFGVDYYYMLKHSYNVAAIWRQYIPLGRNKRLALFAEFQLGAGGSESKFAEGQPIRGTFAKSTNISLGANPGVVAFITNNMALELNVGILGLGYTHTKQVHNQITTGHSSSSNMNFKVNILSIGLGVAFYL